MPLPPNSSPQTLVILDLLLANRAAWHYGYDLSRRSGLKSGTLYPILIRLADRGWLETRWADADRPGRPPRHTYRLTGEGANAAATALAVATNRRAGLRARSSEASG